MSRVGARREREGTIPRATAVPRLAKPARHAGYAPGAHRSIGGCRRSGEAASLRRAGQASHRGVGGAGVPRLSRRLSPAATCGARGSPSVPLSRPVPTRDVSRVGLVALASAVRSRAGSAAVHLGLFLPLAGDPARLRDLLAVAATTAERTGFHSLWFAEHVALFDGPASRYPYSADGSFPLSGEAGILEPFLAIGFAAALTSRIRPGTGICLVPQRPPLYTAKSSRPSASRSTIAPRAAANTSPRCARCGRSRWRAMMALSCGCR